jgi:hypothetical protein
MAVIVSKVDDAMFTARLMGSDKLIVDVPGSYVLVVSLSILDLPCHVELT